MSANRVSAFEVVWGGGGEREWKWGRRGRRGRRGGGEEEGGRRSEGGIGKQERRRDGEQEGRKKRKEREWKEGRGRSRKSRRRKGRRGRWGRERARGNENNTCAHLPLVLQFLLTKVVVASPSSPTMSPLSLDCCVVWRWETDEEKIVMLK